MQGREESKKRTYEEMHGEERAREIRQKISVGNSVGAIGYWTGKKRSKETRKRMSDSHIGHEVTKETRKNISIARTGKTYKR